MLRRASIYYRQVRCVRHMPRKKGSFINNTPNPGIENRLQIFKMETPTVENEEEVGIDIDDLESDFTNVGEIHREFEREKIRAAKSLSLVMTKNRYFKSAKLPNLLTWSEKEQIKYLHQLDSKEWDAESLSTCFPSTPQVIKKILKSQWKPKNSSALERHDKAVERNWILLKEGKLNLEEELRSHFLNFSSRKAINSLSESQVSRPTVVCNMPQKSEFVDLLSINIRKNDENSMEKSIEVNIPELQSRHISTDQRSDSFVLPYESSGQRQLISYEEFKENYVDSKIDSMEESALLNTSPECVEEIEVSNKNVPIRSKVKAAEELVKYKKEYLEENLTSKQLDMFLKAENYAHKIKIPKGKKDPSAIYKVSDCFYDWDGYFLYRVPGMK